MAQNIYAYADRIFCTNYSEPYISEGKEITMQEDENEIISGGSDYHGVLQPQTEIGVGSGNLQIP